MPRQLASRTFQRHKMRFSRGEQPRHFSATPARRHRRQRYAYRRTQSDAGSAPHFFGAN